jgi:hypothetical protein
MVRTIILLCVFAVAIPSAAGNRLVMRLSPPIAPEPAKLTVRTIVEADDENRALQIVAQSADFYRSSWIQLDGVNASRVNDFEFRNLPVGTYEVISVLVGSQGQRATASSFFHVTPVPGSR